MKREGWKPLAIILLAIDAMWIIIFITLYFIGMTIIQGGDTCAEYCESIGADDHEYKWVEYKCICYNEGGEPNTLPEMPETTSGNARLSVR